MRRSLLTRLAAAALAWLLPAAAGAQDYPSKPIRIISPSAPGGLTDIVARLIGERLGTAFKVPVIVENKPGGTGAVALDATAKAPPDGYTLVVGFAGANVIYPLLNDKLPFNAQKDFTPITQVSTGGNFLVVHPSVPVNNVKEFIAYVKAQPKPPSYGSWGNGSGGHLAGEYLKLLTGIDMVHVPYRSVTALVTDMVGGHMPIGFLDATNTIAQVRAGKVRAIAQTGPTRAEGLPDVPTMLDQDVKFGVGVWTGILGPANMPKPVVDKLNAEIVRILKEPEIREKWLTMFGNYPAPTTPAEFDKIIRDDFTVWRRVITEGKITM
jgi:tripartite-type tricarboxylate transporter receptor subunit TctC